MANSSDDALVARLTRTAGDLAAAGPEGAVIRGDKTLAFATDISDLLTAYATVQAERDELEQAMVGLKELHVKVDEGGKWSADALVRGEAVTAFAGLMVEWFRESGGKNFVVVGIRDPRTAEKFTFTVQKHTGLTPADKYLDSEDRAAKAVSELATLRETLVGEVEARLHEKRMSFEMSGPHGDVDYRATFSFDEGGSWVRWPEIAAILNAIKGTP